MGIKPDYDAGAGEVLLFLNSSNTTYEVFSEVMDDLAASFRVIGHNYRSIRVEDCGPFSIHDLAEDTFTLMNGLGIDRWTVVGSSMGGFVGLRSALIRPGAVERLVLIGTSATRTDEQSALVLQAIEQLEGNDRVDRTWAEWAMRICLSDSFAEANPEIVDFWTERIISMSAANIAEEFRASAAREDLMPDLDQIACPTLVIHGTEDRAFTVEETLSWSQRIPNCRTEILPATGHFISIEKAAECVRIIRDFMATV